MLIDNVKKKGVVTSSQARFSRSDGDMFPMAKALESATACVKGKNMLANVCTAVGSVVIEKNVPLRMNIGVMKRKEG